MRHVLLAALLVALTAASPARAAESLGSCVGFIDSVPATITTQGVWCLRADLSTAITSGNAITVNVNNVTIDCNHFKLGGLGAGVGTEAIGVRADARINTTIRNCNIRGFAYGAALVLGSGHHVHNNRFESNTYSGVAITGTASMLRQNMVVDTGGSTSAVDGSIGSVGMFAGPSNLVIDNTISGVAPTLPNKDAYGIFVLESFQSIITGNHVSSVTGTGTGVPFGIYVSNMSNSIIRENSIAGDSANPSGIAIFCSNNTHSAYANVMSGYATGVFSCSQALNFINGN